MTVKSPLARLAVAGTPFTKLVIAKLFCMIPMYEPLVGMFRAAASAAFTDPTTKLEFNLASEPTTSAVCGPLKDPLNRVPAEIADPFTVPPVVETLTEPPAPHVKGVALIPVPPENAPVVNVKVAGMLKQQIIVVPLRDTVIVPFTVPVTTPPLEVMVPFI